MRLLELQRQFQQCLIEPAQCGSRSIVVDTPQAPIQVRVGIYQTAYFLRLLDSLREDYPGLEVLLGNQAFETLISAYLLKYPPTSFSMNHLGARLPEFIAETASKEHIHLKEMAVFEWTLFSLLDSVDEPVLQVTALQTIKEAHFPYLIFEIRKALCFLAFHTNVPQIWQAVQDKTRIPKKKHQNKAHWYVVWCKEGETHYQAISNHEYTALSVFQQGATFVEVCEKLCKYMPEHSVQEFIAELLHRWLDAELFTGFFLTRK